LPFFLKRQFPNHEIVITSEAKDLLSSRVALAGTRTKSRFLAPKDGARNDNSYFLLLALNLTRCGTAKAVRFQKIVADANLKVRTAQQSA